MSNVISRGCDEAIRVELVTADGAAFAIPSGGVVLLGLRPVLCSETVLVVSGVDEGGGVVRFDVAAEDTVDLVPGDYWFDVKLASDGKFTPLIRKAELTIADSAVGEGDGV